MKDRIDSNRRLEAAILLAVCVSVFLPIGTGLWQTASAAFGVLPAIGANDFGVGPWKELFALPGVATAIGLSLFSGVTTTALSLILAVMFCAIANDRIPRARLARALSPILAAPHASMAIGLAFLMSPSGWIARLLAMPMQWEAPPAIASVNDPWGISLILGLMIKEVPFLLLVIVGALTQIPMRAQMAAGRSLGYSSSLVWLKIITPQIWPLIRLPTIVVLAYSLSVVDMALILGPSNPPTLAVILTRLFSDPNINRILPASAGGMLQLLMVGMVVASLSMVERLIARFGLLWLRLGERHTRAMPLMRLGSAATIVLFAAGILAMISLVIWSFAWRWSWPMLLPESWSIQAWSARTSGWFGALANTAMLAMWSTAISTLLAIAWLEGEDRARKSRTGLMQTVIYLPLLVPQVSFLFGMNIMLLRLNLSSGFWAVVWAQSLFVFPYIMIALSDPWRSLDKRLCRTAAALGAGPWRRLLRVKIPVLLAPICTAAAIGAATSVAQYLPTLFLGAGRVATLTTEAVTLSSSSDRRITGVYGSLQTAIPLLGYIAAILVPSLLHRNRRDLLGGVLP